MNLISITKDGVFENMLQNYRYEVLRVRTEEYEFTISNFPLMNVNDFKNLVKIFIALDNSQVLDPTVIVVAYSHIKGLINYYNAITVLIDIELA